MQLTLNKLNIHENLKNSSRFYHHDSKFNETEKRIQYQEMLVEWTENHSGLDQILSFFLVSNPILGTFFFINAIKIHQLVDKFHQLVNESISSYPSSKDPKGRPFWTVFLCIKFDYDGYYFFWENWPYISSIVCSVNYHKPEDTFVCTQVTKNDKRIGCSLFDTKDYFNNGIVCVVVIQIPSLSQKENTLCIFHPFCKKYCDRQSINQSINQFSLFSLQWHPQQLSILSKGRLYVQAVLYQLLMTLIQLLLMAQV